MAQVDFSNATIEALGDNPPFDTQYDRTMDLQTQPYLYDSGGNDITANPSMTVIESTKTRKSIVYAGKFTANGTELYTIFGIWRISNISFAVGDTYSFVVEIEIS